MTVQVPETAWKIAVVPGARRSMTAFGPQNSPPVGKPAGEAGFQTAEAVDLEGCTAVRSTREALPPCS
jgi:hypothetical protein